MDSGRSVHASITSGPWPLAASRTISTGDGDVVEILGEFVMAHRDISRAEVLVLLGREGLRQEVEAIGGVKSA